MMTTNDLYAIAADLNKRAQAIAQADPNNGAADDIARRASRVAHALYLQAQAERDMRPEWVRTFDRAAAQAVAREAEAQRADLWVTGADGTEEPILRNGDWCLYQYNPARHAWRYLYPEAGIAEAC